MMGSARVVNEELTVCSNRGFQERVGPAQLAHEGLATVYSDTLSAHITTLF